jgi:hypothetical protein
VTKLGLKVPEDYQTRFPSYRKEEWKGKADVVIEVVRDLLTNHANPDA